MRSDLRRTAGLASLGERYSELIDRMIVPNGPAFLNAFDGHGPGNCLLLIVVSLERCHNDVHFIRHLVVTKKEEEMILQQVSSKHCHHDSRKVTVPCILSQKLGFPFEQSRHRPPQDCGRSVMNLLFSPIL